MLGLGAKDLVGGARIEAVKGGRSETTGGAKLETVGVYIIDVSESVAIDAKAAVTSNVAGALRMTVGGGQTISAKAAAALTTPNLKLNASGSITFKCGAAKIVVDGGGVHIDGLDVEIKAGKIELESSSIAPG